jgi:hypothetical protein
VWKTEKGITDPLNLSEKSQKSGLAQQMIIGSKRRNVSMIAEPLKTREEKGNARIDRERFPSLDHLRKKKGRGKQYVRSLANCYRELLNLLNRHHLFDSEVGSRIEKYFSNAWDDVTDFFEEEGQTTLRNALESVAGIVTGLFGEAARVVPTSSDRRFLIQRYWEYQKELLTFINLRDPLEGAQRERVGAAVLIYEDESTGKAYSVALTNTKVETLKGLTVEEEVDLSRGRELLALVRRMYDGRKGILSRRNVFFAAAPKDAGLDPEHVLKRAAYLYRKGCV